MISSSQQGTDDDRRKRAQKFAIKQTVVTAMARFQTQDPGVIWRFVQFAHVHQMTGIDDLEVLDKVKRAEQGWKSASGFAFEEMVKEIGGPLLMEHGLEIIQPKELVALFEAGRISNRKPDIERIKHWKKTSIFDLYIAMREGDAREIFGCIQTKTSIRDRVTRDREPSINAMKDHFFSIGVVLEANMLSMPKYRGMVAGGTQEFAINGWHAFYAFSDDLLLENERIHLIGLGMEKFVEHACAAAKKFREERQWLDEKWNPAD
jgi:hypothetical protein